MSDFAQTLSCDRLPPRIAARIVRSCFTSAIKASSADLNVRSTSVSGPSLFTVREYNHVVGLLPLDQIVAAVREHRAAVITAPPGTGKTTLVPPALTADGPVLLLQPRRVAA